MSLVLGDTGAICNLNARFNNVWPAGGKNLTLRCFTNVHAPLDTDTSANYTEAVGGGYAAIALVNGSWTVSGSAPAQAAYAQQTFNFTGALTGGPTIQGYYVTDADGIFQWAEVDPAPFTPVNNGDMYKVTPVFQLSKGTPT